MTEPKRYSLQDVRRSYTTEKAWRELTGELPAYLLYRPLSFPLSYLALRMGIPTLAVTWAGLFASLAMIAAAVRGGPHAYAWVASLGLSFHVLDCVDGNMARTTGKLTRFGAVLDGFVDATFFAVLFVALGLLVQQEDAQIWSVHGVEFGLGATVLVLLNRKLRDHFLLLSGESAVLGEAPVARPSARQWAVYAVAGLENLYAPAIGVAGMLGALWLVLLGAAVYASAVSCAAIWLTLAAALRHDRARTASHAAAVSPQGTQEQTGVLPAEGE